MTKPNSERFKRLGQLFQFGVRQVEVQDSDQRFSKIRYAARLLFSDGFDQAYEVDLTYDQAKKLQTQLDAKLHEFEKERQAKLLKSKEMFTKVMSSVIKPEEFAKLTSQEEVAKAIASMCEELMSKDIPEFGVWLLTYFHHMSENIKYGYWYANGCDIT